jgi:hypothetical protein
MNLTTEQITALDELRDGNGTINARDVVEAGRDQNSELNKLFDWDPARVHRRYLLARAEEIIRSCPRPEINDIDLSRVLPRYRHDPDPRSAVGTYVDVASATKEKNSRILAVLMDRVRNLLVDAHGHARTTKLESEFYARLDSIVNELGKDDEKKPPSRPQPPRRRPGERPRAAAQR